MTKKNKCCKAEKTVEIHQDRPTEKESNFIYAQDIVSFHESDNEMYMTYEFYDDNGQLKEITIIMDTFRFLHSGCCDKEFLKKKVIEYTQKL